MHTRLARLAVLIAARLSCGCGEPVAEAPIHQSVVCADPAEGSTLRCDAAARGRLFDTWASTAVHRPGSRFSVWAIRSLPANAVVVAQVTVPPRWGAGVINAKARFLEQGRTAATSPSLPLSASPLLVGAPDPSSVTSEAVQTVSASGGVVTVPSASHGAVHATVICDRSDSTLGVSCNAAALGALHQRWLARGGFAAGSTFAVWVAGRDRSEATRVVQGEVLGADAAERYARALAVQPKLVEAFADGDSGKAGSALIEAMHAALQFAPATAGTRLLMVSSDLRQATRGTWNFERRAPLASRFREWLRDSSLEPDLSRTEVYVCGLHNHTGPAARAYDAILATRVLDLWKNTFAALGASDVVLTDECRSEDDTAPPPPDERMLAGR